MQTDNLFIPQAKGNILLDTKNKMRYYAFAPLFWQNCFTFRLHVFISICRCFAAQMLPVQFKNSSCYSSLKNSDNKPSQIFLKSVYLYYPTTLISSLSLLSSSLHVFSILCYLLHNSSHMCHDRKQNHHKSNRAEACKAN